MKIYSGFYEDLMDKSPTHKVIDFIISTVLSMKGISKDNPVYNFLKEYMLDISGFYLNPKLRRKIIDRAKQQILIAHNIYDRTEHTDLFTVCGHSLGSIVAAYAVQELSKEGLHLNMILLGSPLGQDLFKPFNSTLLRDLKLDSFTEYHNNVWDFMDLISGDIPTLFNLRKVSTKVPSVSAHTNLNAYLNMVAHPDGWGCDWIIFHGIGNHEADWLTKYNPYLALDIKGNEIHAFDAHNNITKLPV